MEGLSTLLLLAAGCIAGALNVIAGGGSFLTLPILIFMGLPPGVANGTNRVGVLVQNIGAVWSFHRYRVLDWKSLSWAAVPAALGSVFGTVAAIWIPDFLFQRVLAFLMVALTLWTLVDPVKRLSQREGARSHLPTSHFLVFGGFFVVGVYGGFVQAGVGFLLLVMTTLTGLDLVRGNAIKVLVALVFTLISLILFAWQGKVVWTIGLILGAGNLLGGLLGAHLTVIKGHAWVKAVVTIAVVVFAVKLWFSA